MPLMQLSLGQELSEMHREALHLSRNLLPRGHATRVETEKTIREAHFRWKNYIARMEEAPLPKSMSDSMLCFTSQSAEPGRPSSSLSRAYFPVREVPKELPPLSKVPKPNR